MAALPKFLEWQRESATAADFAFIYLEEAHPTDGWVLESVEHAVPQHTSMAKRTDAARILALEYARGVRTACGHSQRLPH